MAESSHLELEGSNEISWVESLPRLCWLHFCDLPYIKVVLIRSQQRAHGSSVHHGRVYRVTQSHPSNNTLHLFLRKCHVITDVYQV